MVCGLEMTTACKLICRVSMVTKFHGGARDRQIRNKGLKGLLREATFFFKVAKFHFITTKLQKFNTKGV